MDLRFEAVDINKLTEPQKKLLKVREEAELWLGKPLSPLR